MGGGGNYTKFPILSRRWRPRRREGIERAAALSASGFPLSKSTRQNANFVSADRRRALYSCAPRAGAASCRRLTFRPLPGLLRWLGLWWVVLGRSAALAEACASRWRQCVWRAKQFCEGETLLNLARSCAAADSENRARRSGREKFFRKPLDKVRLLCYTNVGWRVKPYRLHVRPRPL